MQPINNQHSMTDSDVQRLVGWLSWFGYISLLYTYPSHSVGLYVNVCLTVYTLSNQEMTIRLDKKKQNCSKYPTIIR